MLSVRGRTSMQLQRRNRLERAENSRKLVGVLFAAFGLGGTKVCFNYSEIYFVAHGNAMLLDEEIDP